MRVIDYAKQFQNYDVIIVLFDELGFTDEDIAMKLEISRQGIYNARKRISSLLEALKHIEATNTPDKRNPDVQAIVDAFSESFGNTKTSQYDRFAAKRLADKYGADAIVKVISSLARAADKFAPSVNSVSDLDKKFPQIGRYLTSLNNGGEIIL